MNSAPVSHTESNAPLVLCIDPDESQLEELALTIGSAGIRTARAQSPGEALHQLIVARPQVILVEPTSLGMETNALLRAAQRQDGAAQIIVYSQEEQLIDAMIRVFKVVRKPLRRSDILEHVKGALIEYDSDRAEDSNGQDGANRIQSQLEWLVWRERVRVGDRISLITSVLDTIRHAISQGVGIGSLVTMAEMIDFQASHDIGLRDALADSLPSMKESSLAVRQWINNVEKTSDLLARRYPIEILSADRWRGILSQSIATVEPFRLIKNQRLVLHDDSSNLPILSNRAVLDLTLREILTNALKYSPENTDINVICNADRNVLAVSVRNDVEVSATGSTGVPLPYENQIFEPFFRLQNVFDDRFRGEELGMGIGLTVVQGALNQVGGQIFVHELLGRAGSRRRVTADMTFPFENGNARRGVPPEEQSYAN